MTTINPSHRAVYALVQATGISAEQAPLYRHELAALRRAGLVTTDEAGTYRDAATPTRRPSAPPPAPMLTLVVRVPRDAIAALDRLGPTRSDAARAIIARGLSATTP